MKNAIPYIPTLLPILLFCRHTEIKLDLYEISVSLGLPKMEIIKMMKEETLSVRNTAVDIKIIGNLGKFSLFHETKSLVLQKL